MPILDAPAQPVPAQDALGIRERGDQEHGQQEPLEGLPAKDWGAFPHLDTL